MRLVFWPDVADAAHELNRRVVAAKVEQRKRAREYAAWSAAVDAGGDPKAARGAAGARRGASRSFIDE